MEPDPELADAVRQSFLADVEPAVVRELLRDVRLWEFEAGSDIIDAKDPSRCGIMVDGLARVYIVRADGAEVTLRRVGSGSAIGIKAMIGQHNDFSVSALTGCVVLPLDSTRLVDLGRQHPSLAWAIAEETGRRLDDTQRHIGSIAFGSVAQRVAGFLLDLIVDDEARVVSTQEELADRIGASRESVGRALRSLASAGLIRQDRAAIVVRDARRLERHARALDDNDAPVRLVHRRSGPPAAPGELKPPRDDV